MTKTLWSALLALLLAAAATAAPAQDFRGTAANVGTVGVVSGGVDGTYARIAADLAAVLDEEGRLRVVPVLGKGSVQNVKDILYLKGIDIGIVQSDVLAFLKRERLVPNISNRLKYITKLYNEELHILAAPGVERLEDLAGRKVNVDGTGSGTAMTASLLFGTLGIRVEPVNDDQALALDKLRRGEIAAMAYVAGKPARLFRDLKAEDGLRFLPVPPTPALLETYLPSRLTDADYGGLIRPGEAVDTVAVGAVMAVYGWERDSERFQRVARFVDRFFDRFGEFTQPPRHPKWREVNLAAEIPGWTRFEAADAWLRQTAAPTATDAGTPDAARREAFRAFVAQRGIAPDEADRLFDQFSLWQASAGAR